MPIIKPASELRNNYVSISKLAKESRQPIFLTKNGTGDMVLQSIEDYDKREALIAVYEALSEGEVALKEGRITTIEETSKEMLKVINSYNAVTDK